MVGERSKACKEATKDPRRVSKKRKRYRGGDLPGRNKGAVEGSRILCKPKGYKIQKMSTVSVK